MAQGKEFKGRQFTAEVILWAVRWYLMFPISYRDLELMLQDRGVEVDHTTLFRWIQAYAPELEKRIRPHLHRSNGSWRVDETYVKLDLDTGFGKVVVGQQLTPTDAVVSITRDGSGRRDQAALASRTLGGRAMRAALNSGPMRPVAGVRRVTCRPSLVIATSWSRSRSRSTSPHSGRKPALQQRSSSSLRRM